MGWAVAAVVLIVMLIVDWLIVMGINPKRWKGSKNDFDDRPDQ